MRVGQTRRRDSNEASIIAALRRAGATVVPISGKGAPDILVRFRGCTFAFELKNQRGRRTVAQLLTDWPVVRSINEALSAIRATSANDSICTYLAD